LGHGGHLEPSLEQIAGMRIRDQLLLLQSKGEIKHNIEGIHEVQPRRVVIKRGADAWSGGGDLHFPDGDRLKSWGRRLTGSSDAEGAAQGYEDHPLGDEDLQNALHNVWRVVLREERVLADRFCGTYAEYISSVPRWLPRRHSSAPRR